MVINVYIIIYLFIYYLPIPKVTLHPTYAFGGTDDVKLLWYIGLTTGKSAFLSFGMKIR